MMKKISAITLILLLLGCSINAVSAGHNSVIKTGNCVGNARLYTAAGAETMNWNFYSNDQVTINTDGWRRLLVNPSGWGNPASEASWNYVPGTVWLNPGGYGKIVIS